MTTAYLKRPASRLLNWITMNRNHVETQPISSGGFHFKYDEDADLLFARFGAPQPCDSVRVDDNVVVRVSRETHTPVAIEVFGVTARFQKDRSAINRSFARQLLADYGPEAASRLARRSR